MSNNVRYLFGMMHRTSGRNNFESTEQMKEEANTHPKIMPDKSPKNEQPPDISQTGTLHASGGRADFQNKK
jgi:hypothetical protein